MKFSPKISLEGFLYDSVENEKNLGACDIETTRKNGGPLTNYILSSFLGTVKSVVFLKKRFHYTVDCRIHDPLEQGYFPGVSSWHTDAYPRQEDGTIDWESFKKFAGHFTTCMYVSDFGNTQSLPLFVVDELILKEKETWEDMYLGVSKKLGTVWKQPNNSLVYFNGLTLHRPTPAEKTGKRIMIRVNYSTFEPQNIIGDGAVYSVQNTNTIRREVV